MYPFINHNQNDVISKMFWKNLHTLFYTLGNYVFAPTYDFNRDVTVSTNLWVRILAHKTAILVTTGSVAVAGGAAGTGTVFFRRRKMRVK